MSIRVQTPGDRLPEGSWQYVMRMGSAQYVADHAADLVGVLVSDYPGADADEVDADAAAHARYEASIQIATAVQVSLIQAAEQNGDFTPAGMDDEKLTALFGSRLRPHSGSWDESVPLVLVRTDYEPYTAREVPTGNVVYVNPYTDVAFIESLRELGVVNEFLAL